MSVDPGVDRPLATDLAGLPTDRTSVATQHLRSVGSLHSLPGGKRCHRCRQVPRVLGRYNAVLAAVSVNQEAGQSYLVTVSTDPVIWPRAAIRLRRSASRCVAVNARGERRDPAEAYRLHVVKRGSLREIDDLLRYVICEDRTSGVIIADPGCSGCSIPMTGNGCDRPLRRRAGPVGGAFR